MAIVHHFVAAVGFAVLLAGGGADAGEADVIGANVVKTGAGVYRFDVTVSHGDTGWDHFADAWEVLAPDGRLLGRRTLFHPHEDEKPFTRSLDGVRIPPGLARVRVRAHDKVHGFGGREVIVAVPDN